MIGFEAGGRVGTKHQLFMAEASHGWTPALLF